MLQRELETLKQQLQNREQHVATPPSTTSQEAPLPLSPPLVDAPSQSTNSMASGLDEPYGELVDEETPAMADMSFGDYEIQHLTSNTLPRVLGRREYDAQRIDDCFQL